MNDAPPPSRGNTVREPPWSTISRRAMCRPSPEPGLCAPRRPRLNIALPLVPLIPGPRSSMYRVVIPPRSVARISTAERARVDAGIVEQREHDLGDIVAEAVHPHLGRRMVTNHHSQRDSHDDRRTDRFRQIEVSALFGLRHEHEPQPPGLRGDGHRQLINILRPQAIAQVIHRHRHRLDPAQRSPQFVFAFEEFVCIQAAIPARSVHDPPSLPSSMQRALIAADFVRPELYAYISGQAMGNLD